MAAPTNYAEVREAWRDAVYDDTMANYDPTEWTDITQPTEDAKVIVETFKYKVFPVDKAGLETLCATVPDCTFDGADFSSYAFGFVLKSPLKVDGTDATTT